MPYALCLMPMALGLGRVRLHTRLLGETNVVPPKHRTCASIVPPKHRPPRSNTAMPTSPWVLPPVASQQRPMDQKEYIITSGPKQISA